jgi:POT family proton-dependent oligopeptide transporter
MFNPIEAFQRYAAKHGYLTAPVKSDRMPPGIPYIVGNEGAERFSYYGMRAILVVFMTKYLLGRNGALDVMDESDAKYWYHLFVSSVYFLPFLGAVLADALWGKYRTIVALSIVYCFGHLALALDDTRVGLFVGLSLIALGAGGIKPCVSAHVGDQFGATNQRLLPRVYSWFYFSINVGSTISSIWIPVVLDKQGPHLAFAIPGILMFLATVVFWIGRKKFVHIPPGGNSFNEEAVSPVGLRVIGRLMVLNIFVAIFWSLFDQSSSAWVLQAEKMDRQLLGHVWLASQLQAINPVFVVLFIPIFSYVVYPFMNRFFEVTALRKIMIGFFVATPSFFITAWVEHRITQGFAPSVWWHVLAYFFITAAEILISITGLEFYYTQAPKKMKSLMLAVWLSAVTIGNVFTALVNKFNKQNGKLLLEGAEYYLFFACLMVVAAIIFGFVAARFKVQTFIQDEEPSPTPQTAVTS